MGHRGASHHLCFKKVSSSVRIKISFSWQHICSTHDSKEFIKTNFKIGGMRITLKKKMLQIYFVVSHPLMFCKVYRLYNFVGSMLSGKDSNHRRAHKTVFKIRSSNSTHFLFFKHRGKEEVYALRI